VVGNCGFGANAKVRRARLEKTIVGHTQKLNQTKEMVRRKTSGKKKRRDKPQNLSVEAKSTNQERRGVLRTE